MLKVSVLQLILNQFNNNNNRRLINTLFKRPLCSRIKVIKDLTGCTENEIVDKIQGNMHVQKLSESELSERLRTLIDLNLADDHSLDKIILINHHPITIKHRFLCFKEYGIKQECINSFVLSRFLNICLKRVSKLKSDGMIRNDFDVGQNLARLLNLDVKVFSDLNESNSLNELKKHALESFMLNQFGSKDCDKYPTFNRLTHKSLKEIMNNFTILTNDIGFSKKKIENNLFLFHGVDFKNMLRILSEVETIAGYDIRTVLRAHPKILALSVENLKETIQVLQDFGIKHSAVRMCFEVFTLSSKTVATRLKECENNRFFHIFRHHPRVLKLVIYQKKAKERLEHLKNLNINSPSLSRLSSSKEHFESFCEFGATRYQGKDLLYFLNSEFDCEDDLIRKKAMKHPYWSCVSLLTISNNLNTLLHKGFTKEEILDELCILFYPTEKLLEEMSNMKSREDCETCRDSTGSIRREFLLPLTLYYLERETNFNGAGIWNKNNPHPQDIHKQVHTS